MIPVKARTAMPPMTLPAVTPMLLLDSEVGDEEAELLEGAVVTERTAPVVFEGDAWLLCDDAAEMEDTLGMSVDDATAVVVAVYYQLIAHQDKQYRHTLIERGAHLIVPACPAAVDACQRFRCAQRAEFDIGIT
jgi:hypothetical protein